MWRTHLERLAARFHCLAPDLPGFGLSHDLDSLSLSETTDLLAELIEDRVPTRRAHVVGLSYGGSVVFAMLDRHPGCIDRAVIDGAAVLPVWGGWGDRMVQLSAIAVSPIVSTGLVRWCLRRVGLGPLGETLCGAAPAAFRRAYREGFTAPLTTAVLAAPCPTLLVAGEKEGTVRASNAALAALMPHATAWFVPGLGHAWFAWHRDLHVRMIAAWLGDEPLPVGLVPEPPSARAAERVVYLL
jgi:pimeloyl-ACP methyl ester carboxylesterase